jgi:hypothetical protein
MLNPLYREIALNMSFKVIQSIYLLGAVDLSDILPVKMWRFLESSPESNSLPLKIIIIS